MMIFLNVIALVLIFESKISIQQSQDNPCKQSSSDAYYAVPYDNTMFIQCANGRAYTKQCPKYLVWNNQKKTCMLGNYQVKNPNELLMSSSAPPTISPFTPTITQLEFSLAALKAHNTYRKVHGVPPLVLNTDLMQMAQVAAENSSFQLSHKQYKGFALGESFLGSSNTNTGKSKNISVPLK